MEVTEAFDAAAGSGPATAVFGGHAPGQPEGVRIG